MSAITTHVLDTSRGCPANGVRIALELMDGESRWRPVGHGATGEDGRLITLMPGDIPPLPGVYRLVFDAAAYFDRQGVDSFYPEIIVTFTVGSDAHYHVPLLLSPFGYTTYRGS
jgi:5-hydroxyisourate hydrolase